MNRVNAILISTCVANLDRPRVEIPLGDPIPDDLVTAIYKKMSAIGFDKINNDFTVEQINEMTQGFLAGFKVDGAFSRVTEYAKLEEFTRNGETGLEFYNTFDLLGDGTHEMNVVIGQPKDGSLDFSISAVLLENAGTDHEKVIVKHNTTLTPEKVVYTLWPEMPAQEEGQPVPELLKKARQVGQLAASMLRPLIMDHATLMSEINTNTVAVAYTARDAMLKL